MGAPGVTPTPAISTPPVPPGPLSAPVAGGSSPEVQRRRAARGSRSPQHLAAMLMRHEGLRLKPYTDTTGHLSIGYGRNLTDVGISVDEARLLLQADIDAATRATLAAFPWVAQLDPVRQAVLVSMVFNMGLGIVRDFVTTLRAFREGRWQDAAAAMLDSKWATQVGQRAQDLAEMVRTGRWPAYARTTQDVEAK